MYEPASIEHFDCFCDGMLDIHSQTSINARWRVARVIDCDMMFLKPSDADHVNFVLDSINAKLSGTGCRVELKSEYKEMLCPRKNL